MNEVIRSQALGIKLWQIKPWTLHVRSRTFPSRERENNEHLNGNARASRDASRCVNDLD